jgi:hypothetical protein
MQRGAPAVSDWCVAMGGDSALYARAHPTSGSVSIRTAPYKRNRSGTNARRALRRLLSFADLSDGLRSGSGLGWL